MDYLFDRRGNCLSVMLILPYKKYKELVMAAYEAKGGIEGQREALKTSTAIRIRKRMIQDILAGTVLPPVVIGTVLEDKKYSEIIKYDENGIIELLLSHTENVSLIDGMQRTTAMIEAENESADKLVEFQVRMEVWFAENVNHLIYRMLVLNSGQVPWDIKRQLETVFSSVIKDLRTQAPEIEIYQIFDRGRRSAPGQYQASDILELYLVFGSRKEKIDIKERLADEFVRLDIIEVSSQDDSGKLFAEALTLMSKLDRCFGRVSEKQELEDTLRFVEGKDVFASQPARAGFITATAINMIGRPGNSQPIERLLDSWKGKRDALEELISKMDAMEPNILRSFLALDVLSEKLQFKKTPKVGDFERGFFRVAFETMYAEGVTLDSFLVCWMAN